MSAVLDENTQFVDTSGKPLVGGFIYFGTQNADPVLNPISIFSDRALTIALANPQTLDALGRSTNKVWLDGRYSMRVSDLNLVQIYEELDNGESTSTGVTRLENVSGADTITATATTTITAYVDGELYIFTAAQVNTGAVTLNIDSVGAKSILKNHDEAIIAGEFEANASIVVVYNATDDTFQWVNQNSEIATLGTSFIGGLTTSNNTTDAAKDIDIAIGAARDITDAQNLTLATVLTKQIDASWAVGTDAGGLDGTESVAGTPDADTNYYIWLIMRSDTGVVDVLFSESATAPTLPASYDFNRLIGMCRTDATPDIIAYTQVGDFFRYTGDVLTDIVDSTIVNGVVEVGTLSVPPSSLAHIYGALLNLTSTNISDDRLYIFANGAADDGVGGSFDEAFSFYQSATPPDASCNKGTVLVDSSSQIQYTAAELSGSVTVTVSTLGFDMLTRSNPT